MPASSHASIELGDPEAQVLNRRQGLKGVKLGGVTKSVSYVPQSLVQCLAHRCQLPLRCERQAELVGHVRHDPTFLTRMRLARFAGRTAFP